MAIAREQEARPTGRSFGSQLLAGKAVGNDENIMHCQYEVEKSADGKPEAIVFRVPCNLTMSDIRKKEKRYDDDLGRWIRGGCRIVANFTAIPGDVPALTITASPAEMKAYVESLPDAEETIADLTKAGEWPVTKNWVFPMHLAAGLSLNLPISTKGTRPYSVAENKAGANS